MEINKNGFIYQFKRDDNEKKLAKFALQRKIPIFCICRGFQIMNIVLGGKVSFTCFPDNFGTLISVPRTQSLTSTLAI